MTSWASAEGRARPKASVSLVLVLEKLLIDLLENLEGYQQYSRWTKSGFPSPRSDSLPDFQRPGSKNPGRDPFWALFWASKWPSGASGGFQESPGASRELQEPPGGPRRVPEGPVRVSQKMGLLARFQELWESIGFSKRVSQNPNRNRVFGTPWPRIV